MRHMTRETLLETSYRKVEAMFRKGMNVTDVSKATGLTKIDVLDLTQKIFAIDMMRA